jgi:hypothetical protein
MGFSLGNIEWNQSPTTQNLPITTTSYCSPSPNGVVLEKARATKVLLQLLGACATPRRTAMADSRDDEEIMLLKLSREEFVTRLVAYWMVVAVSSDVVITSVAMVSVSSN